MGGARVVHLRCSPHSFPGLLRFSLFSSLRSASGSRRWTPAAFVEYASSGGLLSCAFLELSMLFEVRTNNDLITGLPVTKVSSHPFHSCGVYVERHRHAAWAHILCS